MGRRCISAARRSQGGRHLTGTSRHGGLFRADRQNRSGGWPVIDIECAVLSALRRTLISRLDYVGGPPLPNTAIVDGQHIPVHAGRQQISALLAGCPRRSATSRGCRLKWTRRRAEFIRRSRVARISVQLIDGGESTPNAAHGWGRPAAGTNVIQRRSRSN
jgi:hypothetical protein